MYLTKYLNGIYNNNTYSDLYKVLYAQMCPSCMVMIERSEGCKFMECAKCKYQFCWLCLSEFYTEYHYYESMCPMRIVPIYGTVTLCCLLLFIKSAYSIEIIWKYIIISASFGDSPVIIIFNLHTCDNHWRETTLYLFPQQNYLRPQYSNMVSRALKLAKTTPVRDNPAL